MGSRQPVHGPEKERHHMLRNCNTHQLTATRAALQRQQNHTLYAALLKRKAAACRRLQALADRLLLACRIMHMQL
jgi:hypothetical protein